MRRERVEGLQVVCVVSAVQVRYVGVGFLAYGGFWLAGRIVYRDACTQ
jgi:hypothetical protein